MNFSKTLILFALGIFLISNASAMVLSGLWQNSATSITITAGNSVNFSVDYGSMHSPSSIVATLYNSNDIAVWTNYYPNLNGNFLSDAIPSNLIPGNYQLILNGNDAANFPDSDTIYLTVNSVVPANNAPVISSISNQTINENLPYSYDVNATDADNDTLTYSIIGAPAGFTINSATGLIAGTAPNVAVNTNYSIIVQVSDGTTFTTQNYTLTVNNVPVIGNAPNITILGSNPITIQAGFEYVDAGATATDAEDGNLTSSIIKTSNVNTSLIGNYTVVYSVNDSAGNIVTATRNVSVVDTTSPIITLNGAGSITITQNGTYTEFGATALDNYDGSISVIITGSVNTSVLGNYTITYTAIDSHGNSAIPITRIVHVVSGSSSSSSSTSRTIHYTDVYENQYQEQLNQTSKPINLEAPQTPSKTAGATIFLIITILLILGILSAIFVLIRKR